MFPEMNKYILLTSLQSWLMKRISFNMYDVEGYIENNNKYIFKPKYLEKQLNLNDVRRPIKKNGINITNYSKK